MKKNYAWMSMALAMALTSVSCSDDKDIEIVETDANYVGQAVGNFTADEWYPPRIQQRVVIATRLLMLTIIQIYLTPFSKASSCLSANIHSTQVLSKDSVLPQFVILASIATQSMVMASA